jgi:hypothetical protein
MEKLAILAYSIGFALFLVAIFTPLGLYLLWEHMSISWH